MNTPMNRRQMLASAIPAAAPVAIAIGTTGAARPLSSIPIRHREFWDPAVEWVSGYEEVVQCTAAERDAFLSDRPEMARWSWIEFGESFVGVSPMRRGPHWTGNLLTYAKKFIARGEYLDAQRHQKVAHA